jgi:hypothetical protein
VASCFWVALSRSRERSRLARRSAGAPFGRQAGVSADAQCAIAIRDKQCSEGTNRWQTAGRNVVVGRNYLGASWRAGQAGLGSPYPAAFTS